LFFHNRVTVIVWHQDEERHHLGRVQFGTHGDDEFQNYNCGKFLNNIEVKELNNDEKQFSCVIDKNAYQNHKEINKDIKTFLHAIYDFHNQCQQIDTNDAIKHLVLLLCNIISRNRCFDKLLY